MKGFISVFVGAILVAAFGYAAFLYFAPTGSTTYTFKPGSDNLFISEISPENAVESPEKNLESKDIYQRLLAEPVYFDVIMPRLFQKATVEIEMENGSQPAIYAGIKADDFFTFDYQALHYQIFERKDWKRIDDTDLGISIYYRTKKYGDTIQEIIDNLTEESMIFELDVPVSERLTLDEYKPLEELRTIETSLRGAHEVKIYAEQGEEVFFGINWYDINRGFDRDQLHLRAYSIDGTVIKESIHEDDGDVIASGSVTGPYHTEIAFEAPYEGIFTIRIMNTDDMVFHQITSNSRYLVFPQLFLAGQTEYPLPDVSDVTFELTTNGNILEFQPARKTSNQTILINGEEHEVKKDKENTWETYISDQQTVISPSGDLYLGGNGFWALEEDQFFLPSNGIKPYEVDDPPEPKEIEVLFGPLYEPAEDLAGNWVIASTTFDIQVNHIREDNTLTFSLMAPGIENRQDVIIREIRVTLEKEPISMTNLVEKVKGYIKRKL